MNLALWNIERAALGKPERISRVQPYISALESDIIVLTEASNAVYHPGLRYAHSSKAMPLVDDTIHYRGEPVAYHPSELRTRILSRYPITAIHRVSDPQTNCCADLDTPSGVVRVLATIVGVQYTSIWDRDFENLRIDLKTLALPNMVLAGDFNVVLPPINKGKRQAELLALFSEFELTPVLTLEPNIIDHFVLGKQIGTENRFVQINHVHRNTSDHPIIELKEID